MNASNTKEKRYALVVYGEEYSFANYNDDVYFDSRNDSEAILLKETDSFPALMRMWNRYLEEYAGFTYCVRDRMYGPNAFLVGGVYDACDDEVIRESNRENNANSGDDVMRVRVKGGFIEARSSNDPYYPGICVEFVADNDDGSALSRPSVLFEQEQEDNPGNAVRALIWADSGSEDANKEIYFA